MKQLMLKQLIPQHFDKVTFHKTHIRLTSIRKEGNTSMTYTYEDMTKRYDELHYKKV